MERTLISLNVPNFITIGFIAIASFFLFALIWQTVTRALGMSGGGASEVISTGGSASDELA